MIDLIAKYLKTGSPSETGNTDYCKVAQIPILNTPHQTAIKVIEAILFDIELNHSKLKFFKENGYYKAITGPETHICYFIKTDENNLDFTHEVWVQTMTFLP